MADDVNMGGVQATVGMQNDIGATAEEVKRAMDGVEAKMKGLNRAFNEGKVVTGEYTREFAKLEMAHGQYQRQLDRMQSATAMASGVTVAATGSTRNFGNSILFVSNAIQDFSAAGMMGVTNNIAQIAASFGLGAGLAGGAMAAGMAIQVLTNHWGTLQEKMGAGIAVPALEGLEKMTARVKELDKQIEDLRAKKRLDLSETFDLKKATDELKTLKEEMASTRDFKALTEGKSKETTARGGAFAEAVRESGGSTAFEELVQALKGQVNAKGLVAPLGAEVGTPEKVARELFVNASRGDATARDSIRAALMQDAGLRGSPFAARIAALSPEQREAEGITARNEREATAERKKVEAERTRKEEFNLEMEQRAGVAAFDADKKAQAEVRDAAKAAREREDRKAMEKLPGLGQAAEREYMGLLMGSGMDVAGSRAELERRLMKELEAAGMGGKGAIEQARDMAARTARGVNEDVVNGRFAPDARNSRQFGIQQLNASLQSAVNNDNPLLVTNRSMLDQLVMLNRNVEGIEGVNIRRRL